MTAFQSIEMIQTTPDVLRGWLKEAAEMGATQALRRMNGRKEEKPIPTAQMMKLLGIKKPETFRARYKALKLSPVGKAGNSNLWLPSQFGIEQP